MDNSTLVKIREMLEQLGWSEEVIDNYCEEYARGEEDIPAE